MPFINELKKTNNEFLIRIFHGDMSVFKGVGENAHRLTENTLIDGASHSPITIAGISGNIKPFVKLLNYPAVTNRLIGSKASFLLNIIVNYDHLELFNKLLEQNNNGSYKYPEIAANINCSNNEILVSAIRLKRSSIASRLLSRPEIANGILPMVKSAFELGKFSLIDNFLTKCKNGSYLYPQIVDVINLHGNDFLQILARKGSLTLIKRLLGVKEDGKPEFPNITNTINDDEGAVLWSAATQNNDKVVSFLLSIDDMDPSLDSYAVFDNALRFGRRKIIEAFLNCNRNDIDVIHLIKLVQEYKTPSSYSNPGLESAKIYAGNYLRAMNNEKVLLHSELKHIAGSPLAKLCSVGANPQSNKTTFVETKVNASIRDLERWLADKYHLNPANNRQDKALPLEFDPKLMAISSNREQYLNSKEYVVWCYFKGICKPTIIDGADETSENNLIHIETLDSAGFFQLPQIDKELLAMIWLSVKNHIDENAYNANDVATSFIDGLYEYISNYKEPENETHDLTNIKLIQKLIRNLNMHPISAMQTAQPLDEEALFDIIENHVREMLLGYSSTEIAKLKYAYQGQYPKQYMDELKWELDDNIRSLAVDIRMSCYTRFGMKYAKERIIINGCLYENANEYVTSFLNDGNPTPIIALQDAISNFLKNVHVSDYIAEEIEAASCGVSSPTTARTLCETPSISLGSSRSQVNYSSMSSLLENMYSLRRTPSPVYSSAQPSLFENMMSCCRRPKIGTY